VKICGKCSHFTLKIAQPGTCEKYFVPMKTSSDRRVGIHLGLHESRRNPHKSSAVVCLNKESSLRVRVQYKREVLIIRVLWMLSSRKEKKRSLAGRRHL